jgi:hypothetical protein
VQKFENKLAEFRELQNKIINKGGVSLIDEHQSMVREEDKTVFKDVITNVVRDFLVTSLGGVAAMAPPLPVSATPPQQLPTVHAQAASSPVVQSYSPTSALQPQHATSTPVVKRIPATKRLDGNESSASSSMFSTPLASFSTPKEEEPAVVQQTSVADEDLQHLLKDLGLRVDGEKVFFPTERHSPKGKKYKNEYAKRTLDRVVTYIIKNESKVPHNTKGALAHVYETLRKSENFEGLVQRYPNLKFIDDKKAASSFASKRGSGVLVWHTLS